MTPVVAKQGAIEPVAPLAIQPAGDPTTCAGAIDAIWPAELRDIAKLVSRSENGSQLPGRISAQNYDGTYDYGCFQINSIHQGSKGWNEYNQIFDPMVNAQVALKIFQGRGNWSAWYAVCTPERVPKHPGVWCE